MTVGFRAARVGVLTREAEVAQIVETGALEVERRVERLDRPVQRLRRELGLALALASNVRCVRLLAPATLRRRRGRPRWSMRTVPYRVPAAGPLASRACPGGLRAA
jgi:hypothetical protein